MDIWHEWVLSLVHAYEILCEHIVQDMLARGATSELVVWL